VGLPHAPIATLPACSSSRPPRQERAVAVKITSFLFSCCRFHTFTDYTRKMDLQDSLKSRLTKLKLLDHLQGP
jgi:hypothetical protein